MEGRTYIAVDLKSFYASVECVERGLDPLTTNLVVADLRRTEKTICLAVTPSLKAWGISGRARLFESEGAKQMFLLHLMPFFRILTTLGTAHSADSVGKLPVLGQIMGHPHDTIQNNNFVLSKFIGRFEI